MIESPISTSWRGNTYWVMLKRVIVFTFIRSAVNCCVGRVQRRIGRITMPCLPHSNSYQSRAQINKPQRRVLVGPGHADVLTPLLMGGLTTSPSMDGTHFWPSESEPSLMIRLKLIHSTGRCVVPVPILCRKFLHHRSYGMSPWLFPLSLF